MTFLTVFGATESAQAKITPGKAASLAKELGEDRTAGTYLDRFEDAQEGS